MSLLQPTVQPPIDVLREVLASGVIGRLALGPPRPVQVYCMHGAVLAALAPDDGEWMVRRLVNNGALTARQGEAFARSVEQGRSAEDLLLGHVPDRLFHQLLRSRFEENLLPLFSTTASCQFTPMDALFVRNIQVHHDTGPLLATLARRASRIASLSTRTETLTLRPGPSMPGSQTEARLRDLCDPARPLRDLLDQSPSEPGVTLETLQSMLEAGCLVSDEGLRSPTSAPHRPSRSVAQNFAVEDLFSLEEPPAAPTRRRVPAPEPSSTEPSSTEDLVAAVEALDEPWSLHGGEVVSLMPVEALRPPVGPEPASHGPEELPTDEVPRPADDGERDLQETTSLDASPGHRPDAGTHGEAPVVLSSEPAPVTTDTTDLSDEEAALFGVGLEEAPAAAAFYGDPSDDGSADDLSMFADQDDYRGGGQGQFTLGSELLDVVDLRESSLLQQRALVDETEDQGEDQDEVLEAFGAEDTELTEADKVVSLRFGAPRLRDDELYNKLEVCNDVLAAVARSLERCQPGSGLNAIQLLLDGTPSSFAGLFNGLQVCSDGTFDLDEAASNLERRPDAQRRTLLSRGSMDLVERALSVAAESLGDADMETLLTDIAGYQQRMRS